MLQVINTIFIVLFYATIVGIVAALIYTLWRAKRARKRKGILFFNEYVWLYDDAPNQKSKKLALDLMRDSIKESLVNNVVYWPYHLSMTKQRAAFAYIAHINHCFEVYQSLLQKGLGEHMSLSTKKVIGQQIKIYGKIVDQLQMGDVLYLNLLTKKIHEVSKGKYSHDFLKNIFSEITLKCKIHMYLNAELDTLEKLPLESFDKINLRRKITAMIVLSEAYAFPSIEVRLIGLCGKILSYFACHVEKKKHPSWRDEFLGFVRTELSFNHLGISSFAKLIETVNPITQPAHAHY